MVGQLTDINMDAKTFVLKDTKGNAHSFAFSAARVAPPLGHKLQWPL